ncbi:MAG: bifunctional UDP-N-acetylglucosamine diphosphorylase/glucosamine-1-phosphate N-acetyltransferase GlmU [Bifidobacteriaceae bacterium]|jgi:bifunctional UDP-N-acetylglucosamine pyrophosphorylase/glucosamine-1-phosphate N-acetyltransferase|nr:bifunctional UDP-N-acetylglucosamine diphosphorylase/glucosamine-1-phosphate N-acetyltransferase GlmU [Bifidobacteriaceae bacterium]
MTKPAVIVLAAGEGTRMKSALPKVLHQAAGRSLLGHAIAAAQGLDPSRVVVVVRHGRDQVAAEAKRFGPAVLIADQDQAPGTGRAVQCALAALDQAASGVLTEPVPERPGDATGDQAADAVRSVPAPSTTGSGDVGAVDSPDPAAAAGQAAEPGGDSQIVVICGDTPLIDSEVLQALVAAHEADGNGVTMLTAVVEDPFGYGRVVRDQTGQVARIVEEADATAEQAAINEINASVYVYDVDLLRSALQGLDRDNSQGEFYLTDVVAAARAAGRTVRAIISEDPSVVQGVNDRAQLAQASAAINQRIVAQAMIDGVTVIDPASTWIDVGVELEPDVTLMPGTRLSGATAVGAGSVIGPFTTLVDTVVGQGAIIDRTVANGARVGTGATVGPFTHLRPGTVLGQATKAGSFTELKAARVGYGAKVPHLAYVGDADVGEFANVGAGTIFANYDGVTKSKCVIGPAVRIGSNNVIVAPVEMGAGSYSGAGAIVRGDVPAGALAVSAGPQRVIEGWTMRKRPGSDSALAAERALSTQTGSARNIPPATIPAGSAPAAAVPAENTPAATIPAADTPAATIPAENTPPAPVPAPAANGETSSTAEPSGQGALDPTTLAWSAGPAAPSGEIPENN